MAMNRRLHANKTRSLLIKIDRRDRKFLKGARIINAAGWGTFLNEHPTAPRNENGEDDDEEEENEEDEYEMRRNNINKELSIYLMSSLHLAEANLNNDQIVRKAIQSRDPNLIARSKSARNITTDLFASMMKRQRDATTTLAFRKRYTPTAITSSNNHCYCEKLRKGTRRSNTKYLLMANVLKSKNLFLSENSRYNSYRRHKRDTASSSGAVQPARLRHSNGDFASIDMHANATIKIIRSKGGEHEIIKTSQASPRRNLGQGRARLASKKYRELASGANASQRGGGKQIDLIYLTNFVQWYKARAFIDFLDNDSISKQDMCKNIKRTVKRINRAFNTL
jgi:hypothetical protein